MLSVTARPHDGAFAGLAPVSPVLREFQYAASRRRTL